MSSVRYRGITKRGEDHSENEETGTELRSSDSSTRTLDVWLTSSHINFRVTEGSDKKPLYFIHNSALVPGTPDVTLHAGGEKAGPVVGVARFTSILSQVVRFGLGDPDGVDGCSIAWEEMRRRKDPTQWRRQWVFGITLQNHRREFRWRHTRDVGPEALKSSAQNFELVDEEDTVLAVFGNNGIKSWHKKGKLMLICSKDGLSGEQWEQLVLLTALTLVEKLRRIAVASRGLYGW